MEGEKKDEDKHHIASKKKKNPKSPNYDMNNLFLYPKKEMNLIVSVLEIRLIRIKITVEKKNRQRIYSSGYELAERDWTSTFH